MLHPGYIKGDIGKLWLQTEKHKIKQILYLNWYSEGQFTILSGSTTTAIIERGSIMEEKINFLEIHFRLLLRMTRSIQ